MLDRARGLQSESGLENIEWRLGDSTSLPFADATFDCVITRFSFHHFLEPLVVLGEMKRVVKKSGTVLVADVTPREEAQIRFNEWEILRDPSHTRGLTSAEFRLFGESAGLELRREESFALYMNLDDLLKGSFPKLGDDDRIRAVFEEDIRSGAMSWVLRPPREQGAI